MGRLKQWGLAFLGRRAALFLNDLGFVVLPAVDVQDALKALAEGASALSKADALKWKVSASRQALHRTVQAITGGLQNTRRMLRYDD